MSDSIITNPNDYEPSTATLELFRRYCDLGRDEVLQRAREAHQAGITRGFPFRCIQEFRFIEPRISHHPLFQTRPEGSTNSDDSGSTSKSLLDIGCCMGTDMRYLLSTGAWTAEQVLGVDIQREFLDIGMDILYKDRDKMESSFMVGNVLDDESPMWSDARIEGQQFDVVYTGSVLHLLLEDDVEKLVATVSTRLLKSGGTFCGRTVGWRESARSEGHLFSSEDGQLKFLYPPSALKKLLERHGLVDVEVATNVTEMNLPTKEMTEVVMMSFHGTKPS